MNYLVIQIPKFFFTLNHQQEIFSQCCFW